MKIFFWFLKSVIVTVSNHKLIFHSLTAYASVLSLLYTRFVTPQASSLSSRNPACIKQQIRILSTRTMMYISGLSPHHCTLYPCSTHRTSRLRTLTLTHAPFFYLLILGHPSAGPSHEFLFYFSSGCSRHKAPLASPSPVRLFFLI